MRATPPSLRMSAGTRSSAITAHGARLLRDLRLLGVGDVHDHAALQHLGEADLQLVRRRALPGSAPLAELRSPPCFFPLISSPSGPLAGALDVNRPRPSRRPPRAFANHLAEPAHRRADLRLVGLPDREPQPARGPAVAVELEARRDEHALAQRVGDAPRASRAARAARARAGARPRASVHVAPSGSSFARLSSSASRRARSRLRCAARWRS